MEETSEGTCGGTAGLEASVVEPLLKEVVSGKAAEQQSLLEEEGSAVLGLRNKKHILCSEFSNLTIPLKDYN